jgi:hypothetical protein
MRKKGHFKLFLGSLVIFLGGMFLIWYFLSGSFIISIPGTTVVKNPVAYRFGVSTGTILSRGKGDVNAELDDLVSLNIGWLRFDIDWSSVQPNDADSFNWNAIDRLVTAANIRHIKLLPILDYTPPWARQDGCFSAQCRPADNSAFATFAAAAVQRYASQGIHNWEIWNEPNLKTFWEPSPDAADYTDLLKAVHNAIKSEDPTAFVVTGGVGPANTARGDILPVDFISQLYENNAKNYFDAIGVHPYSFPSRPANSNAWSQISVTNPSLRSIMITNSDASKQIWMTEFGAPTDGPGAEASLTNSNLSKNPDHVSEGLQSTIYQDGINLVRSYSWAGPLFFYSYKDLGTSNSTNENFFGILRYDGSQKPVYQTIKQMLAQ